MQLLSGDRRLPDRQWADFTQITRSKTVAAPVASAAEIADIVTLLLSRSSLPQKVIRLLGVTLSSLDTVQGGHEPQLALHFDQFVARKRKSLPREEVRQAFPKNRSATREEEWR